MIRFTAVGGLIATALLLAACSDTSTAPSALRAATGPAFELGNPPPPPLTGLVDAEFDASDAFDASFASAGVLGASDIQPGTCAASTTIPFSFDFFANPTGTNAFLHLRADDAHLVTIHQTDNKLDVHGSIIGDGFVFDIADADGGSITNAHPDGGRFFSVSLSGTLTTADGTTCTAQGNLSGHLGEQRGN